MADSPSYLDYRKLLTTPFKQNDFWSFFAKTVSDVFYEKIEYPRYKLRNIRDPRVTERSLIQANVKNSGFTYKSTFFDDDDYKRLMQFLALYYEQNGTKSFIDFLGYVKNTRFESRQLWTNDYSKFIPEYQVDPLNRLSSTNDEGYYPTSHVALLYDLEQFPLEDATDLTQLFYILAPIHLVLESVTGSAYGDTNLYLATGGGYSATYSGLYLHSYETDIGLYLAQGQTPVIGAFSGSYEHSYSDDVNIYSAQGMGPIYGTFSGSYKQTFNEQTNLNVIDAPGAGNSVYSGAYVEE